MNRKEYLKEWNNTHKRIYLKQRIFRLLLRVEAFGVFRDLEF